MSYYNERLHVERVYIARLVYIIGISCVHGLVAAEIAENALTVLNQVLYGTGDPDVNNMIEYHRKILTAEKERKIRNRVALLEKYTIERFKNEHKVAGEKALLTVYYFIENLCKQKYLNLYEGSLFSEIIDELLVLLDEQNEKNSEIIEGFESIDLKRRRKALYEAGVWLSIAKHHGYFKDALWVI